MSQTRKFYFYLFLKRNKIIFFLFRFTRLMRSRKESLISGQTNKSPSPPPTSIPPFLLHTRRTVWTESALWRMLGEKFAFPSSSPIKPNSSSATRISAPCAVMCAIRCVLRRGNRDGNFPVYVSLKKAWYSPVPETSVTLLKIRCRAQIMREDFCLIVY